MLNQVLGSLTVIVCIFIYYLSYRNYKNSRINYSLVLIILGGLVLRIFVGTDLYLHTWDEQFHALVAKNLLKHPLVPTLYDNPVLPYDYKNYTASHIYLEKGPVPLWAISASLQIFGINEIAVRIPSIIVSLLSVYFTFLISSLLFDKKTGLLAAFFHSVNGLLIQLAGGRVSSDHIETFFIFFIELAVYITFFYILKRRNIWLSILIGISTGLAILCKWFPALIVMLIWIIGVFLSKKFTLKESILNGILVIAGCLVIGGPWIIYIRLKFPRESAWVINKVLLRYSDIVEGHSAPFYYYINKIGVIFGELIYIPLIISFYQILKKKADWKIITLTFWWVIPVLVFSFAASKRYTYLMLAAPAFFILLSYYWFYFYNLKDYIRYKWIIYILLFLLIALPVRYAVERTKLFSKRERNPEWTVQLRSLNKIEDEKVVLFNIKENIRAMFYTDYTVYPFIPTDIQIETLTGKGYKVYINDDDNLPAGIINNPDVTIFRLDAL
jgi:4-amino-4-deoxy-L-arabinose transferase-like glycosyltransferase